MNKVRILHLTDFHINNPYSENEKLREGFYIQFITELVDEIIKALGDSQIDIIVATGDFIDQGDDTEHGIDTKYSHVNQILNFLIKKIHLEPDRIAKCIGNHDYKRSTTDKSHYKTYINDKYSCGKVLCSGSFYEIIHQSELDIFIVEFDSTSNQSDSNLPIELESKEIDAFRNDLYRLVPDDKILLVLSHYPMITFNNTGLFVSEEQGWIEKHYWKSGYKIVDSVTKLRKKEKTLWFYGDSHIPDFRQYDDLQYFFMTGMIGGDYMKRHFINNEAQVQSFNKTNEVKVIEYATSDSEKTITTYTFTYSPKGQTYDAQTGDWSHSRSAMRNAVNPFVKEGGYLTIANKNPEPEIELISDSVEKQIIEEITNKKLYQFNRFVVTENESSLGWIQIHKIFENKELLSRCFDKSIEWINSKYNSQFGLTDSIYIGIDFWGAMFSSYCSVRTNIKNFCFATKHDGKHNTNYENIMNVCKTLKKFEKIKNIVLFTDVVASGNTINKVKSSIKEELETNDINWSFVSIISDRFQNNRVDLSEFKNRGALCCKLKIPILKNSDMPEFSILPGKYDLR